MLKYWIIFFLSIFAFVCNGQQCVPATCCHPTECVDESLAPNCSSIGCGMVCQPNTLDCGGECYAENGQCKAILVTSDTSKSYLTIGSTLSFLILFVSFTLF